MSIVSTSPALDAINQAVMTWAESVPVPAPAPPPARRAGRPRGVPSYRRHKASGQAVVTLTDGRGGRKDVLLGKHNTKASRLEYARVIAEWEAADKSIPVAAATPDLTVNEMMVRFMHHAMTHYVRPDGSQTSEVANFKYAAKFVIELYGDKDAATFGPLALKAVRSKMVEANLCRNVCNRLTNRIRRIFKWAVSEELVPASILEALRSVASLARGRSKVRESEPVKPVPEAFVDAICSFVPRSIWSMVSLQRLTGMRPGEVCVMRAVDIDMTGPIWQYRPSTHKNAWRGTERVVSLGPKAQEIVRRFLGPKIDAYLFSPAREHNELMESRRMSRTTPMTPSQEYARRRVKKRRRPPGDHWRRDSYSAAILAGCRKAGVPSWSPNQLRHLHGTVIRKQFGLEAAQVALGHAKADVTQLYAERNVELASKVAAQVG